MESSWNTAVMDAVKSMRNDGEEDFTVKCGGREWNVHKHVLSMHSSVLRRMCRPPFKEATEKVILLSDDEPDCVENMINYFYTTEYYKPSHLDGTDEELAYHCKVYILGDKYNIPHLKSLAKEKVTLDLSQWHAPQTAESLVAAALVAYDAPHATAEICTMILDTMIKLESMLTTHPAFVPLLDYPQFALDAARTLQASLKEKQQKISRLESTIKALNAANLRQQQVTNNIKAQRDAYKAENDSKMEEIIELKKNKKTPRICYACTACGREVFRDLDTTPIGIMPCFWECPNSNLHPRGGVMRIKPMDPTGQTVS